MRRFIGASTRNRVLVIIGVIALCLWIVYPIQDSLKLGLDLNGGVQLVLRVKTDDPSIAPERRDEVVEQAMRTIDRRVNELGVSESVIQRYTAADQILVELPGVSDVERAKQIIKSTAQLRLTLVEQGPFVSREAALLAYNNAVPADLDILPAKSGASQPEDTGVFVVHRAPAITGTDLRSARQSLDEFNRPAVAFTLSPEAASRFGTFTERHINRRLATVLDGRVMSVATIHSRIDDSGQIAGVSREEMLDQIINLNAGALPADLEYVEERTVGASLGAASIRAGVLASFGGLVLVLMFMLAYYRLTGINALISVVLNLLILLALMAYIPVTLTLPGIAGLILTIGMGVDSNVLIFERIKEELAAAQSARSAVKAAFTRVWLTIVDTHVTSLIAAAFLFQFGTTSIRGFATTLAIGLLANVFTAVFVSRTVFEVALRGKAGRSSALSIGSWQLFANTRVNFTRWRWHALALSIVVILAGVATVVATRLPLGIDFSGGTLAVVEFTKDGVTEEQVRAAVSILPGDEIVQRYGAAANRQFMIRLALGSSGPDGLQDTVRQIAEALKAAGLPEFEFAKRELVSAMIGSDLQRRGAYAVAASLAAIAIYIAMRFRFAFAMGAIAATLHDVLITLACVSLAGYDLTLNVVAALLTIIGYSVNDTIVIFDRVRENAAQSPALGLNDVVNRSVNQTLSRTVITAGATFLSVIALYLFGGEALQGFAFTMLVGIAAGTYSTVFIASAIAILLSGTNGGTDGRRHRRAAYTSRMTSTAPGVAARLFLFGLIASQSLALTAAEPPDWSRFRGPNGSGISTATKVPTEFGPDKNVLWKLPLPQGHSSPILQGDRIYLTALRDNTLVTIAIDRGTGKILWERGAPQVKTVVVDKRNNPASPSPAVEDNGVYVFFPDYGLIGYDRGGTQLWAMPLGPFNNIYGMGASPVIVGDNIILACDQSLGSYLMAVNKRTGAVVWKVDRPEAKSGHSTPIIWRGPDRRDQIILPGSFLLTSYDAATGRKLWWVGGLSFEMKSTPVISGDTIYVNGYGAPVNDPGNKITVPTAEDVWKTADTDANGVLSKAEFPKFTPAFWFDVADLNINGSLTKDEWSYYRAAIDSENGMLAIRLGGSGDMTDQAIRWKYQRSVPQLPSPIVFNRVLYMVNDNGIVTTLNPDTGAVIKQGRLTGAPGAVFASPIAADGNLFFTTEAGAVVVVAPGGDLAVRTVNNLNEDTYATPAFADGRIYVRTTQALYAFGVN